MLDPDAFAATTLERALADMTDGRAAAAAAGGAAESLGRIAESLRRADEDETGLVPLVGLLPEPPPPARVLEPAVDVRGAGDLARAGGVALAEAPPSRRSGLAGRSLRIAALGGAALALAAGSGMVLWASENPAGGAPRPAGESSVPAPAPLPTMAVAPPATSSPDDSAVEQRTTRRTSRTPITADVTTTTRRPAPVPPPVVPRPGPTASITRPTVPEPDPDPTTTRRQVPGQNATLAAP